MRTRPKKSQTTELRTARTSLEKTVRAAEAGERRQAALESQHERALAAVEEARSSIHDADELDREPLAARGRALRAKAEELQSLCVDAKRAMPKLNAAVQKAAAALSASLAAITRAEFDRAVQAAAKALRSWCSPTTAARLAGGTDRANELRARMSTPNFCPDAASARRLLGVADKALRSHE